MKRVYIQAPLSPQQTIELTEDSFHHLFRVMRCRGGENVIAFNGDGNDYSGTLEQTNKKQAVIQITHSQSNRRESPLHVTLLQGLSKGDRMDTAIQKAVELGVNDIYPVNTAFSAVKLDEKRQAKKHNHWQSIIISACEQSERAIVPTLHPLQSLEQVLPQLDCDHRLVLHPYLNNTPTKQPKMVKKLGILIGPEGGLSEHDLSLAQSADFHYLQLGQRILRTETATVSALSLAQHLWGDWHV